MQTSKLNEVSVYRSGFFARRTAAVELTGGKQTVVIEKLSSSLDPSTLRVSLPASVKASNVQVESLNPQQKNDMLADLKLQLATLENRITIKQGQIEMYTRNADFSEKTSISVNEMADYIEKLPERVEKIYEEIENIKIEKTEVERLIKEKNKEANCLLVKVDLEPAAPGTYPLELRYFDTNAGWRPIYEIHTSDEGDSLSLRLKADIYQNTNETWQQVDVTLFTGNPTTGGNIPQLSPVYVNYYSPIRANSFMSMKSVASGSAARSAAYEEEVLDFDDEGAAEEMVEYAAPTAQVVQNDTMMEYQLAGKWDITADNSVTADLSETTIDCEYHVVAVPKADEFGYLAARVKTTDIESLLQTTAIVYHNGEYLGEVYLNPDLTKETYELSLGRDESIKLKRINSRRFTSNVLLKGQKKTEYIFDLRISSSKNKTAKITLLDQIPVSRDKTIIVDNTDLTSGKFDEKTGEVKWEFDLNASESKTFTLAYSISYAKDKSLNI